MLAYIDSMKDDTVSLAMELLKIPTVNPPGRNYKEFAEFVAGWLSEAGLNVEIMEVPKERLAELAPEGMGLPRFHIVSTLKGSKGNPLLFLHGHYDTVPPCAGWTIDPLHPVIENDRLFGLGASDMKGAIVSMMVAAKALVECDVKLTGDLVITTTGDEERNIEAGVLYLLKQGLLRKGDYAIVGEPSGISDIHVGMKGGVWGWITVKGKAAHGSTPFLGVNAFEKLARVVVAFEDRLKPKLKQRVCMYPTVPKEGVNPTLMLGGTVEIGGEPTSSVVPGQCTMSFDRRVLPQENVNDVEREIADLLEDLEREDPELEIEMRIRFKVQPPPMTSQDSEICKVLVNAVKTVTGKNPTLSISCVGNESIFFQEYAKTQVVVHGPGIAHLAHSADEYILVDHMLMAAKVYALTILRLLT